MIAELTENRAILDKKLEAYQNFIVDIRQQLFQRVLSSVVDSRWQWEEFLSNLKELVNNFKFIYNQGQVAITDALIRL